MLGMETSAVDESSTEHNQRLSERSRLAAALLPLSVGAALLVVAAIGRLAFGATSPGFTYLAVVLTLGAVGALLAAGLKV